MPTALTASRTGNERPTRLDHDPQLLRRARVASGLTIANAAQKAGISADMWAKLERGERNGRPPTLKRCADALGVAVIDLMPPAPVAA